MLTCETFGSITISPNALKKHEEGHKGTKFEHFGCNKTFTRSNDNLRHYKYRCPANPDRIIVCKHCLHETGNKKESEVKGTEQGLLNYLITAHGMDESFLCLFCHQLFSTENKRTKHNLKCTKKNPGKRY